jgi:hypothetical protein
MSSPHPLAPTAPPPPPDSGPFDVAFVLLLLQTAFGLVAILGTIVFAIALGGLPVLAGAILLGLAGPALTLTLAIGVARFRRWARRATIIYQALLLLGILIRLVIGREFAFGLAPLVSGVVLPAAILALLLSPSARHALAATRTQTPLARLEPPATLESAA